MRLNLEQAPKHQPAATCTPGADSHLQYGLDFAHARPHDLHFGSQVNQLELSLLAA